MNKKFNIPLKESADILGVSYRTVRYYKDKFPNEVTKEGRNFYVTQEFINKVKNNRDVLENKIFDSRSKEDLIKENTHLKVEIKELKEELEAYKPEKNEVVEVFTDEEYALFKKRLQDWYMLRKEVKHKEELIKKEAENSRSKEDLIDHYKAQFDYQKKLSDNALRQSEKLIETANNLIKSMSERNTIEATEKGVIKKSIDL